jgi:dipeptide/tripeptide permease
VVYLHEELGFDMDYSTSIYHFFELLIYIFPTIAAIIADGFAGLYKTLILVCVTFSISCAIIAAGSVEQWNLPSV